MQTKTCSSFLNCTEEKKLVLIKKGHTINQCLQCGHRFTKIEDAQTHLSKVYSDDYFFAGKDGYTDYLKEKDLLYRSGLKYAKILSKYTKPGLVLDVGSGAGFILKGLQQSGWQCYGVEPNDTMAAYGRNELNLDIRTGSLEGYKTDVKFDLVNMIQVIGHLYDIDKALLAVSNLLKKEGLVLVESWDMESTVARLSGKNWHEYCPPSVITWFSDETLEQAFLYYGLHHVATGRPSKRINVNHGLSLIDESFPKFIFKKKLLQFFGRVFGKFNVPYPAVDLKWYLFKKL